MPPAVAGLLCNDFELPAELPPATLLDLAARHVVRLEEVEPGKTICRLRGAADAEPLTPYERRVLDEVRRKAVDGVVPADALTTGTEDASRGWHRAFGREVIGDAQDRGLTRDRWPGWLVSLLGVGPFAIGGLLYLSSMVGGESSKHPAAAAIAGGLAVVGIILILLADGRLSRSMAQLPTAAGKDATARLPRPACAPARGRAARRSVAGGRAAVGPALRVRGCDGRRARRGRALAVRHRGRQRGLEPLRRAVATRARRLSARLAAGLGQAPRVRHVPRRAVGRGRRRRALRAHACGAVSRRSDHVRRSPLRSRPARLDRSRCAAADDPGRARPAVGDRPARAGGARLLAQPEGDRRAGAGSPATPRSSSPAATTTRGTGTTSPSTTALAAGSGPGGCGGTSTAPTHRATRSPRCTRRTSATCVRSRSRRRATRRPGNSLR